MSAAAKLEASILLYPIERTLQQGIEEQPLAGAIGPADGKMMLLVGHDTNIAAVAALLGLNWKIDGRADDIPPGTELVFELWQDSRGSYSVQVAVAIQTMEQMRTAQDSPLVSPPARESWPCRDAWPARTAANGQTFAGWPKRQLRRMMCSHSNPTKSQLEKPSC